MRSAKKIIVFLSLIIIISISAGGYLQTDAASVKDKIVLYSGKTVALINGEKVTIAAAPFVKNGTTMVPLRFISQDVLKAKTDYNTQKKLTTISHGEKSIVINNVTGLIYKDGKEYRPNVKPTEVNSHLFVPLRLISELFGCNVSWDKKTASVTVITEPIVIIQPVADFSFSDNIIAGQPLNVVDLSSDPLNRRISVYEWEVIFSNGSTVTYTNLDRQFKPAAGSYKIKLRIKTSNGIYSEWVAKRFTCLPNYAPVITQMSATKPSLTYNIGESMDFTYQYTNEEWEKIAAVKWKYQLMTDGKIAFEAKSGKPRALFVPGTYCVSLELQDEYGNRSVQREVIIEIRDAVEKRELDYHFNNLMSGELLINPSSFDYETVPRAQIDSYYHDGAALIKTNNPEKVPHPGIIYSDSLSGDIRIHIGHCNYYENPVRFQIMAENTSKKTVYITMKKASQAGPSSDMMQVGTALLIDYFQFDRRKGEVIALKSGESVMLNAMNSIKYENVLSSVVEFECSGFLEFTIAAVDARLSIDSYKSLKILPRSGPQSRGTYKFSDINIKAAASDDTITKMEFGFNDAPEDRYLIGYDNTTGARVINEGNWGVKRTVTITAKNERIGVLLNPRGVVYRGVLKNFDGSLCYLSNNNIIKNSMEAVVIGVIEPNTTETLTYFTPGGSYAAVYLVLVPEKLWDR